MEIDPEMLAMLTTIITITMNLLNSTIVPYVNKDLIKGAKPFVFSNQISRKSSSLPVNSMKGN